MAIKIYELCGANEDHLFSPHCWKTRMSLAHKGVDFDIIPTPFTQVATIEGGDCRRVPVIRDGDTVVEESMEIAAYLDATHPDAPTLLGDANTQALTKFVINWSQTQLHPEVGKLCLLDIYNSLAPKDQEFFRASREKMFGCTLEEFSAKFPKNGEALNKVLTPIDLTLKNQSFIGGETPMFADYVVFGALQWLRTSSPLEVLNPDSAVSKWFETMLDLYDGMARKAVRPNS